MTVQLKCQPNCIEPCTAPCAVEYIAAFLLITTGLVPFGFFLGMSGDNAVLPGVRCLRLCACSLRLNLR